MLHMLHIESAPIRLSLALLGLGGFVVFILPMLLAGIVNFGNVCGATFCLAFAVFFVWNHEISVSLVSLCARPGGRLLFGFVAALLALGMLTFLTVSGFMLHKMHDKPTENAKALVVLGCKVRGERPSRMLRARLDVAYEYLRDNPETVAVVSGGQGSDEQMTEALCMYRYLTDKGIAPERILQEDKSVSTYENLLFSMRILEEAGISTDSVVIATDGFHQLRASILAKKVGWQTDAAAAKTRLWLLPTYWVREVFGVLYSLL